jgi:hypothetical protein
VPAHIHDSELSKNLFFPTLVTYSLFIAVPLKIISKFKHDNKAVFPYKECSCRSIRLALATPIILVLETYPSFLVLQVILKLLYLNSILCSVIYRERYKHFSPEYKVISQSDYVSQKYMITEPPSNPFRWPFYSQLG